MMRAKMKISMIEQPFGGTHEVLHFQAVSDNSYPPDGSSEDNTYAKWTPQADLRMVITNPALMGKFNPQEVFYVDFTRAY